MGWGLAGTGNSSAVAAVAAAVAARGDTSGRLTRRPFEDLKEDSLGRLNRFPVHLTFSSCRRVDSRDPPPWRRARGGGGRGALAGDGRPSCEVDGFGRVDLAEKVGEESLAVGE